MTKSGNLWAIGYDDMDRANQVREEVISLGGISTISYSKTSQWSSGTRTDRSRSTVSRFRPQPTSWAAALLGCSRAWSSAPH
jgi:hypothetical protein